MASMRKQSGFSLVELSIVLVILGLLVGGVLSGQALIRAAALRSVSTDLMRYQTAYRTFQDKYFAAPGDLANATSFWPVDASGCPSNTNLTPRANTCNGDGNGQVWPLPEVFRAWQHLANAGLVEGLYAGVGATAGANHGSPGVNSPISKLATTAAFGFYYTSNYSPTDTNQYQGTPGNALRFGARSDFDDAVISAEEAWNIDTKMDDGRPGFGAVRAPKPALRPNCTSTASPDTATYLLSDTTKQACNLQFFER